MDLPLQTRLGQLHSKDRAFQSEAYYALLRATDQPVEWAYEVWDGLVSNLKHPDAHVQSIAAQLLSGLVKSDPEQRILRDFDTLFAVTYDAKFITARHNMQSFWKVGIARDDHQKRLIDALTRRYHDCADDKNATLMRYDIVEALRRIYDMVHDETIRTHALALIAREADRKYRKKYSALWRETP